MQVIFIFLAGFLVGGLLVRYLMIASDYRGARPHHRDPHYLPASRAVAKHLSVYGTLNLAQAEQMLSVSSVVAMRYLDQMERDGLVKAQGHGDTGVFYTRA